MNRFTLTLTSCLLSITVWAQSEFRPISLGKAVNTNYDEIGPIISPDGKTLYFVIDNHPENTFGENGSQDIWFAELNQNHEWGPAKRLPSPFNLAQYNSIESVSPDGNTILIRGAFKNGEYKGIGFSFVHKTKEGWSLPEKLVIEEYAKLSKGIYCNAFLANDGNTLLLSFSESKKSETNNLYVSFRQDNNTWSKPVDLGAPVNTAYGENTPFLASDGVTLYFSSDRPDGFGNYDIYMTKRLDQTWKNWSAPVNLGNTINTSDWDSYYSVDATGEYAYLVSDLNASEGLDLVKVKLQEAIRPEPVMLITGKVFNAKTNEPLHASITYETLPNGTVAGKSKSDPSTGTYTIVLPYGQNYGFRANAEGFIAVSDNLNLKDATLLTDATQLEVVANKLEAEDSIVNLVANPKISEATGVPGLATPKGEKYWLKRDLYLVPIEVGQSIPLNNVFFDFNKSELKSESYPELDRVITFLGANSQIEIEIAGHTDNVGTNEYNQKLALLRVEAVKSYLTSKGISDAKIILKSYGESKPLAANETEEGRQQNRRVEFTILKK